MTDLSEIMVSRETYRLEYIEPKFIDFAWRDGATVLGEICSLVEEITSDQLKLILSRGERHLVSLKNGTETVGWATFRVDQYPNFRVFKVLDLWAENGALDNFIEPLKNLALSFGCLRIRCNAFDAQARLYRQKLGFQPVYTEMELKL